MTDDTGDSSEVSDFKEILSHPFRGELPLLVGGHAVNVWATLYQEEIGGELDPWQPLTSKDLDLYGDIGLLDELKARFGGEYRLSGPRSPVVGQLSLRLGGFDRKVDVLRNVVGLNHIELCADPLILRLKLEGIEYPFRVLPSHTLLQAKIANLATLDQTTRHDFKHVNIMLLVNREIIKGLLARVESGDLEARTAIGFLEKIRKMLLTDHALACAKSHGIAWQDIWPMKDLRQTLNPKIQNFVKHWLT